MPQYQVYYPDGQSAFPKTYRLIEMEENRVVVTEITKNDEEELTVYEKKDNVLKKIKKEDTY
jgi:hypothetical protein